MFTPKTECPEWARSMVRNYRTLGNIPETFSDVTLFNILEGERLTIMDDEDAIYLLKQELGLE